MKDEAVAENCAMTYTHADDVNVKTSPDFYFSRATFLT